MILVLENSQKNTKNLGNKKYLKIIILIILCFMTCILRYFCVNKYILIWK